MWWCYKIEYARDFETSVHIHAATLCNAFDVPTHRQFLTLASCPNENRPPLDGKALHPVEHVAYKDAKECNLSTADSSNHLGSIFQLAIFPSSRKLAWSAAISPFSQLLVQPDPWLEKTAVSNQKELRFPIRAEISFPIERSLC